MPVMPLRYGGIGMQGKGGSEFAGSMRAVGEPSADRPERVQPRRRARRVFADMILVAGGAGEMTALLTATVACHGRLHGAGSLMAMPVMDITRLIQRRREEEEFMALLLLEEVI